MAHTVFICHASDDKQVADAACAALEAQRIPCWIAPRDILAGEEYQESIVDALSDSQIVLLIFSAHANDSPQVRREIERAVSKGKIVVPFRIEDVLPSRAMEFALSNTHWLNAITPPLERHLTELCHAISRLLQKHKEAEPPLRQAREQVVEESLVTPEPATATKVPTPSPKKVDPAVAGTHRRLRQTMTDLKLILQNPKVGSGPGGSLLTFARRFSSKWLAAGVAIVLLAGFLIGLVVRKATQSAPSFPVVRTVIKLEPGLWLDGMRSGIGSQYATEVFLQRPSRTAVTMSKDGRFIIYSAVAENSGPQAEPQLYLRRTDQLGARPIAGTEGGINPFLSPDDQWVGFWADGRLMKVSVDGGVPVTLCNAAEPFGASWALDNSIVFANGLSSGLFRVSAEGGNPESLTTPDKASEEYSHRLPYCLPDGKSVLFTIMREAWDLHPRIALLDLKTRKWRVLMEDAADARYVPMGHLVFLRQGTLMVVLFDLGKREVMGEPVPAIANVMQALNAKAAHYNTAAGQFIISDSGWLVYAAGTIFPDRQDSLAWVDHKGKAQAIASFKAPFFGPHLSPDGQRIAYMTIGKEQRIWVYDLNRGTASQLTDEGKVSQAIWTPDGKRLVFAWWKGLRPNLYWQQADGSSAMEQLTMSDYMQFPGSWSPDGATLAFVEDHPDTGDDIFLLDLRSRRITPFLNSPAFEGFPEFSPDGRWMAYVSDESGRMEVYVRPFPGPGGKWQISQEGGIAPLWARDGKQLFYYQDDGGQIWAVDVRADGGFSASKPRLLFKAPGWVGGMPIRSWDVSLDGQRFLMVKNEGGTPTPVTELVLVMNWSQDLQRLAPSAKK